ncbi:(d)CMP kinase [Myxococcota bacterium]|nr:(d)CMP kinase [Myxococcota bacterium]
MTKSYIVAIDGPAGAGKSTIARLAAARLGLVRVDTGAIYRAVALYARQHQLTGEDVLAAAARALPLALDGDRVLLEGRDVTAAIRTEEISAEASRVSALPGVRAALLDLQRRLGREHPKGAVLEGRDIGTVVFPDAEVKIFLTASPEQRARRRVRDLEAAGAAASYDDVLASIEDRDQRDASRAVAPLRPAADAVLLDSTALTLEEVLGEITRIVREKVGA